MSASPSPSGTSVRTVTREHRAEVLRAMNRPRWRWRFFSEYALILVIAVPLFVLLRTFGIEAFKIPSGSMENTLLVGDFLLVNKAIYGARVPYTHVRLPRFRKPRRGDIIVFRFPRDERVDFVKRLIGLPGDTVEMRGGRVLVNGVVLDEPYVVHSGAEEDPGMEEFGWQRSFLVRSAEARQGYHPSRNTWGPLVVPKESYFVLGDNRDNSYDSRYWGFVPDSLLAGQPWVVYYSYERDAPTTHPWLSDIRWSRIGTRVH